MASGLGQIIIITDPILRQDMRAGVAAPSYQGSPHLPRRAIQVNTCDIAYEGHEDQIDDGNGITDAYQLHAFS